LEKAGFATMVNMKIFALYVKINLTKKPEWFEEFLNRYFEPVDLHITLIQPRYINEKQIDDLESKVAQVMEMNIMEGDKKVVFNDLIIDKETDGKYTFMLNCRDSGFLANFQKELRSALKDYCAYVDDTTKEYEANFKPHITIAIDLDNRAKEEAERYFISDYRFEGLLGELVLSVVKDKSLEERNNANNIKIFKFV